MKSTRFIAGNLTGTADTLSVRETAGNSDNIKLIINARVETSPQNLDQIVRQTLDALCAELYTPEIIAWRYLQPGRPQPAHRFTEVV